jgi:hypothetical protein
LKKWITKDKEKKFSIVGYLIDLEDVSTIKKEAEISLYTMIGNLDLKTMKIKAIINNFIIIVLIRNVAYIILYTLRLLILQASVLRFINQWV